VVAALQLGPPSNVTTWYQLLTDVGSMIGGFLALVAGLIAYFAGLQAKATREAAKAWKAVIDADAEIGRATTAVAWP
jgi:hypothetical protein